MTNLEQFFNTKNTAANLPQNRLWKNSILMAKRFTDKTLLQKNYLLKKHLDCLVVLPLFVVVIIWAAEFS